VRLQHCAKSWQGGGARRAQIAKPDLIGSLGLLSCQCFFHKRLQACVLRQFCCSADLSKIVCITHYKHMHLAAVALLAFQPVNVAATDARKHVVAEYAAVPFINCSTVHTHNVAPCTPCISNKDSCALGLLACQRRRH